MPRPGEPDRLARGGEPARPGQLAGQRQCSHRPGPVQPGGQHLRPGQVPGRVGQLVPHRVQPGLQRIDHLQRGGHLQQPGRGQVRGRRMIVSLMPRPAYGAVAVTDSFSPGSLIGNAHQAPASGCQPARTGVVSRPARCRVSAATRTRPLWHPQAPPPRSEPGSPARARARPWPSGGGHRARRRRFPSGSGDRRPQAGPVLVSCSLAAAPGRRARTSPMAGSWLAGSGSGRCAWIW